MSNVHPTEHLVQMTVGGPIIITVVEVFLTYFSFSSHYVYILLHIFIYSSITGLMSSLRTYGLGTFIKIKEPDGYAQKKRKIDDSEEVSKQKKKNASNTNTLDRYFKKVGNGQTVGGGSLTCGTKELRFPGSGRKLGSISNGEGSHFYKFGKRLDGSSQESIHPVATSSNTKSISQIDVITLMDSPIIPKQPSQSSTGRNMQIEIIDIDLNSSVICPSCNETVLEYYINDHLDHCIG
uniref:ZnF_Rad18 domain-containing protein n=1 Tax=Heterorhabditis bacteriophora TaxID=37862 RepID=A0A1I7X7X5_HETBA